MARCAAHQRADRHVAQRQHATSLQLEAAKAPLRRIEVRCVGKTMIFELKQIHQDENKIIFGSRKTTRKTTIARLCWSQSHIE
eukprot:SAG11_NODE_781_length_7193_cov_25.713561_6_plen_83_part_00